MWGRPFNKMRGGEDSGALKLTLGIADLLDLTSRPSKVWIVAAPTS